MKTQVELLKECCDIKDAACVRYQKRIAELEKENKELKEEVKKRKMIADENGEHYDMMKDEYEKLEKENKELKKELKKHKHYYDRDKEELMESCYALAKENKELKKKIEKLRTDNIYEEGLYN